MIVVQQGLQAGWLSRTALLLTGGKDPYQD